MIRLCALNDDSSEESEPEPTQESVKQAKVRMTMFIQLILSFTFDLKFLMRFR